MKIFIDTSAWLALEDKKDTNHDVSIHFRKTIYEHRDQLFTTNYILDETYTIMLLNIGYLATEKFVEKINLLKINNILTIVFISEEIHNESWKYSKNIIRINCGPSPIAVAKQLWIYFILNIVLHSINTSNK
jgi:predicted nucleic acid-binding protein